MCYPVGRSEIITLFHLTRPSATDCAGLLSFAFCFNAKMGPLAVGVALDVEPHEHYKKEDSLRQRDADMGHGEATVLEQRDHHVKEKNHELNQLELRQVALLPKVFLNRWPQGREEVVGVHDDVNEAVEDDSECDVAVSTVGQSEPTVEHHQHVVHHVQRRYMRVFLAQHEEHCV